MAMSKRAFATMLLSLVLAPVQASAAAIPPFELIRTLQRVQDQVATGSVKAHRAQLKLLDHIAERFARADGAVWREPRNLQALVSFLLSGGNPQIGRNVYGAGIGDETYRMLVAAALAYSEGRQSEATRLFQDIDPLDLPATLGGHVALVKAALYQSSDPEKTIRNLELARLLLPGTLIEEAALRRAMVAAGNNDDIGRFELFARQYVKRFRGSVYGAEFDAKFSQQLVRLPYLRDVERRHKFADIASQLDDERQVLLLLLVARNSVVAGKHADALFAVEKAMALSQPNSKARNRLKIYEAAAQVLQQPGEAQGRLKEVDTAGLPEEDRQIVTAALELTKNLLRLPGAMNDELAAASSDKTRTPVADERAPEPPGSVAAMAEQLIQSVDEMLK